MPSRDKAGVHPKRLGPAGWVGRCYFRLAERLYTSWAWAFDPLTFIATFGAFPRWRRAALHDLTGRDILEVGHGSGALLVDMARAGLAPTGLEISAPMHRLARRRLTRKGLYVPRVMGDARALPFRSGSFDTIVATFPADFARCQEALEGFARVLRPGKAPALVFVGVCLDSPCPTLRAVIRAITGVAPEVFLRRHIEAAQAAGFHVKVRYLSGRFLRVPILVASGASITNPTTIGIDSTPTSREQRARTPGASVAAQEAMDP